MHLTASEFRPASEYVSPTPVNPVTPDCARFQAQFKRRRPGDNQFSGLQIDCQVTVSRAKCSAPTVRPQAWLVLMWFSAVS